MALDDKEKETLKQLLVLEKEFHEYNVLLQKERLLQKEWISRLWVLTQRYILLESNKSCGQLKDIYKAPAEDMLLQEFTEKMKLVKNSNCHIYKTLDELRKSYRVFEKLCTQLSTNMSSPFMLGDAFRKPIAYFIELFSDLFKYFHAYILRLRYLTHQFDPFKIESIENYQKQLEPSEDFQEYFNIGLSYCKCLRPRKC